MYSKEDAKIVWNGWTQMKVYLEHNLKIFQQSKGIYYYDQSNQRYIDGISNLLSSGLGHNNDFIRDRVIGQLDKLDSCTLIQSTSDISIDYANKLIGLLGGDFKHLFYTNSGSEGFDTAVKLARQYFYNLGEVGKKKVITLKGCYHGSTIAAICAAYNKHDMRAIGENYDSFLQVKSPSMLDKPIEVEKSTWYENCITALEETIVENNSNTVAAIIVEPVQISNAVSMFDKEYFQKTRALCDKYNILLIVDEVATGFGRTGSLLAYQQWGIIPDVLIIAKSMTNGVVPLGGVLVTKKIFDEFIGDMSSSKEFSHGYTSGGNPIACAAAIASLDVISSENILKNVITNSDNFIFSLKKLENYKFVKLVQGCGYMAGIKIDEAYYSKKYPQFDLASVLVGLMRSMKFISYYDGENNILIAPPLICTSENLSEIAQLINKSFNVADKLFDIEVRGLNGKL